MGLIVARQNLQDHIGEMLAPGEWFVVDQSCINQFADVTLDHQFIHVDKEKAGNSVFGSTIAHGFLSLSMLTHLMKDSLLIPENCVMGINYGFDKVRFLNPVKSGSAIRACATVAGVEEKKDKQILVRHAITVEIKGQEKPALVCEWLNLFVCE